MKLKHILLPLLILCLILTACKGKEPPADTTPQTPEETPAEVPAETPAEAPSTSEISEAAMDNFLAKLDAGNYVMEAGDYLKATAYSRDLVYFEYTDDAYNDFAVMSVNNEAFQAPFDEDGLGEVSFVNEGQAIDAAKSRLLNYWMDESVSEGNIYNLFYNMQEDPLRFVSYENAVKRSVLSLMGYSEMVLDKTQEVYLVLDAEDPAVAHVQAVIEDDPVARIYLDDIDIALTFGAAKGNPAAEEWMKAPVYPEARTDWNEMDEFILNSVFLPEYGRAAVPFPAFASYGLMNDQENFVMDDEVTIRDSHATEEDMAAYIAELIKEGFAEAKETSEDGTETTYYRRMLREETKCYSSIHLAYDNGITMVARKYYDFPVTEDLAAINRTLRGLGYAELPASDNFKTMKATDRANELTESWLYFFDYDTVTYVDIDFDDYDKAVAYIEDYEEALTKVGFAPAYADDEDEADRYESENGFCSFRYNFLDDDTVSLLFKAEKYIPAKDAEKMIADAGFPKIQLKEPISCRDLKKFEKVQYGLDLKAFITVSQTFDTVQEAGDFFDAYEAALNDAGFDRDNPAVSGTNKQIAIVNEEKGLVVGIDFFEQGEGAAIYYDFRAD